MLIQFSCFSQERLSDPLGNYTLNFVMPGDDKELLNELAKKICSRYNGVPSPEEQKSDGDCKLFRALQEYRMVYALTASALALLREAHDPEGRLLDLKVCLMSITETGRIIGYSDSFNSVMRRLENI